MDTLGRVFETILNVFFGNVRRAGWTIGFIAAFYFAYNPQILHGLVRGLLYNVVAPLLGEVVTGLVAIVGPLMQPLLFLILFIVALRFLTGSVGGKKRRK